VEAFLLKVFEYLLAQGPLGILCISLFVQIIRESKRNEKLQAEVATMAAELKELAKDAYGVLAVTKDRLK